MLAKDLGMTVSELTDKMSFPEWQMWVQYYEWEASVRSGAPATIHPRNAAQAAHALDKYAIPALRAKQRVA